MKKSGLLDKIQHERTRLKTAVAAVPPDQRDAPVLPGGWSVKSSLAHIAAWEQLTIVRLQAARSGAEPDTPPIATDADVDRFNDQILAESGDRSYAEVAEEFEAVHAGLLALVGDLSEADLQAPLPEPWGRGRSAWQMVASNTFWHYPEHTEAIEQWPSKT